MAVGRIILNRAFRTPVANFIGGLRIIRPTLGGEEGSDQLHVSVMAVKMHVQWGMQLHLAGGKAGASSIAKVSPSSAAQAGHS